MANVTEHCLKVPVHIFHVDLGICKFVLQHVDDHANMDLSARAAAAAIVLIARKQPSMEGARAVGATIAASIKIGPTTVHTAIAW